MTHAERVLSTLQSARDDCPDMWAYPMPSDQLRWIVEELSESIIDNAASLRQLCDTGQVIGEWCAMFYSLPASGA